MPLRLQACCWARRSCPDRLVPPPALANQPTRFLALQRPELGGLLVGALQAAVAAPRALPHNKQLRARFISFLHRMLECLGAT